MIASPSLMPDVDFAYDDVPNLHELLDQLRQHGPVVPVTYHENTAWLINGFEELQQAFLDEEHFEAAPSYRLIAEPSMGKTIQTMSGEEHRVNRGLVSRSFFPAQVRQLIEPLLVPIADELLDKIEGEEEVDLVASFSRPYPFKIITRMLGIPVDDEEKLLAWALKLIDYPWDPEGSVKAKNDFATYLKPIVDQRRENPGNDILSALASEEFEGKRLTDEEIFSFARMLFPAGSDTTYKLGSSLFSLLLADPELRQRAMASDEERAAIVQEAARWQSPTALLPRLCTRDVELGGVQIKAGDPMLFGIIAANSDPRVFDKPLEFNPDRDNKNLAFGQGAHFCVGSHLARAELATSMERIFSRFPNMALCPDKPPQIVGGVLRGAPEVWVRPNG